MFQPTNGCPKTFLMPCDGVRRSVRRRLVQDGSTKQGSCAGADSWVAGTSWNQCGPKFLGGWKEFRTSNLLRINMDQHGQKCGSIHEAFRISRDGTNETTEEWECERYGHRNTMHLKKWGSKTPHRIKGEFGRINEESTTEGSHYCIYYVILI